MELHEFLWVPLPFNEIRAQRTLWDGLAGQPHFECFSGIYMRTEGEKITANMASKATLLYFGVVCECLMGLIMVTYQRGLFIEPNVKFYYTRTQRRYLESIRALQVSILWRSLSIKE